MLGMLHMEDISKQKEGGGFPVKRAPGRKRLMLCSVFISAVCAAVWYAFFLTSFSSAEESMLFAAAAGIKTAADPYLVVQSSFLGRIYRLLYGVSALMPWYAMLMILSCMLSLAVVIYAFLRWSDLFAEEGTGPAWLVPAVLVCYFIPCFYGSPGSRMTAGMLGVSAVLSLADSCTERQPGRLQVAAGFVLGAFGVMYCCRMFFFCAGAAAAGCLAVLFFNRAKTGAAATVRFAGLACLLLSLTTGLYLADRCMYLRKDRLEQYRSQYLSENALRLRGLPSYAENNEYYKQIGISRKDWRWFDRTGDYDREIFTEEVTGTLRKIQREKMLQPEGIRSFREKCLDHFRGKWCVSGLLTLFLLWLVCGKHKKARLAVMLLLLLLVFALWYICWCGGLLPAAEGAEALIYVSAVMCGLFFLSEYPRWQKEMTWLCCVCVLLLSIYFLRDHRKGNNELTYHRWQENALAAGQISEDGSHLYLRPSGTLAYENICPPLQDTGRLNLTNIAFLGLEDLSADGREYVKQMYGVEDPYRDMIGNDKVFLIDDNIKTTLRYIRSHYDPDADAVEAGTIRDRTYYSIISG